MTAAPMPTLAAVDDDYLANIAGPCAPHGAEPWPTPQPFPDVLPDVPELHEELLPRELRAWAVDIAERMSCPLDYVGVPAIIAAGSLIGRRVGIRPQEHTDWVEAANLWGVIVGEPGTLKSPAVREALAPLRRMEAKAAEAFIFADVDHAAAMTLNKIETKAAERAAEKAAKQGDRAGALAGLANVETPATPKRQRFITSDATAEKLHDLCADNPNGLLVERDELVALLRDLDNEEKVAARALYMTGWSGMGSHTMDRIGRGTVHAPAVCISLIGTIQPARLSQYLARSLKSNDDGMVQRLQMLSWPSPVAWRECDRSPNRAAREAAWSCFDHLATLQGELVGAERDPFDPDAPPTLRFDEDALAEFRKWRAGLEARLRTDNDTPAFVAHLSKYRGLIPRLALVCHLAGGGSGPVGMGALLAALGWAEYLEAHARRAYGAARMDEVDAARAIWRRIERGDLSEPFTAREVKRKHWGGLDADAVDAGLRELVDLDRLRLEARDTGGRPADAYAINPKAVRR